MWPESSRPRYGSGTTVAARASPPTGASDSGEPSFGQKRASIPKRSPHVGQIFADGLASADPDAPFTRHILARAKHRPFLRGGAAPHAWARGHGPQNKGA